MVICLLIPLDAAAGGVKSSSPPPNAKAHGKTLADWMRLYYTWRFGGDQENPEGQVHFLPIPAGEYQGGSGTPEDPVILEGHADVTLPSGASFFLPIAVWYGEEYAPDVEGVINPDPEMPEEVFDATEILVTLDGRPIITTADKWDYYVPPEYFEGTIFYDEPTDYGAIGAVFVQGFGFLHRPLPVGTHVLTLDSSLILQPGVYPNAPDGFGVEFHNTWTITVVPRGQYAP